ncbi:hypothetical protein [Paenibacillus harenae]|uniref:hypothetical protein n=1 Tax=Paenibacillus harenae TaxID=306543 RepID=UPI000491EC64|nr:hypothetical protein [Paenibacillus harenae]
MKHKSILGVFFGLALIASTVYASDSTKPSLNNVHEVEKSIPDYPTNEQGQTFGSGPFPAGEVKEPDLIMAEGENGVVGYVKSSDLVPSVSSPEEALAHNKLMKELGYKSLPLYEADGKTIIGEFRMYSSTNGDK